MPAPVPTLYDVLGKPIPPSNDPAWQPPTDPLTKVNVEAQAKVVHREIPNVSVSTGWDVPQARRALNDLVVGSFGGPAQLADNVMFADSRVQSALASRLSIFGRPVDFRLPPGYRDSSAARECRDAFIDAWPTMAAEPALAELQRWAIMLGFGVAQLLWDTGGEYAIPHPLVWHPRFTYYHWMFRCYVAISLDGQEPIIPGNASWMLHTLNGADRDGYRSWMRGAVSAITPWWLARAYALRDWARYSERHGLPMLKAKTPAVGDPDAQANFRAQLARLGQETVLHLPQNPPPALSYDVELMEAKDTAHEGFRMLIEQSNSEITLAILAQTLTTSMPAEGGSSYAAARVHADVRQGLLESDARALSGTIYWQLARPFAAMNFGNPDLAPRVVWDVTPYEDAKTKALTFMQLAQALNYMRVSGFKLSPEDTRRMITACIPGFDIGELQAIEPLALAVAGEKADASVPEEDKASAEANRGHGQPRAAASMPQRFDPRIMERVRFPEAEDDALREAMAMREASDIERAAEAMRRRART
jgi:phage gp29-like protein